jgi:hypothetical protein
LKKTKKKTQSSRAREPRSAARRSVKRLSQRPSKSKSKVKARKAAVVSRVRATAPARATHIKPTHTKPTHAKPKRREPIPSPLPTRHVAVPLPTLVSPARSMPPVRDGRRPVLAAQVPFVAPEFSEAGMVLAITYSIREGRRNDFFELLRELKPLVSAIGGTDCTVYEDRSRPNYFMEVFRFKDEAEFTAFDDKFHKDRKIAAVYALLDDIVEAEKSDFKIFERRL